MTRPLSLVMSLVLTAISGTAAAQYSGQCESATDVDMLPPGHWCEVPGSHLREAAMNPEDWPDWDGARSRSYESYQRVSGVRGTMRAWSGAAWDSRRDRLVVFGGGHNDYGGNEIYAFELGTLSWTRLTDPTAFPNRHPEFVNADATPISRHTYGGLAYIEYADSLFAFGGAPDSAAGGCGVRGTWTFDLRDAVWRISSATGEPPSKCEDNAVYDSATRRVYYTFGSSPSGWAVFDLASDSWTALGREGARGGTRTVIPGDRRMIVEFGNNAVAGGFRRWLLDGEFRSEEVLSSGPRLMETVHNPGAAYDPVVDRIVAWSGGTDVYTLDVDGASWERVSAPDTNRANPGPVDASGGTYGRFRYSRTFNVYVTVDAVDENVFLYRLGEGTGLPPPDATRPDVGQRPDAATPDADGTDVDAGAPGTGAPVTANDASGQADATLAGAAVLGDVSGGCTCSQGGPAAPVAGWLALIFVLTVRRSHSAPF